MPTIYTQAESNVRKTYFYLFSFLLLIIAVGWAFSFYYNNSTILWFFVGFSLFLNFFSYFFSDKIILLANQAHPIKKEDNPELYRLVENLCIAAGLPLPQIYIINEVQPNAFATGRDANHAAVAVTRGLLEKLDRAELEGVIAHELSHIGNKDMLLQTIVVALVGVIAILSDIFYRMSWRSGFRRREERNNDMGVVLALISLFLLVLAPISANLLKLAISRKREFLADASGALLTRYPEGLALALEKIGSDQTPLRVANNSTAHLFISNPFKGQEAMNWVSKLFSTHPPIEERIKALREMDI